MFSLKLKFAQRLALAAAVLTQTACQTTLTEEEGYAIGAGLGTIMGEAVGQNIEDRRLRNAVTGGAAVIGGALGGATAAQQGHCEQDDRTTRTARRDNTTGRVIHDETRQTRTENCTRRTPNNQNGGLQPIF